METREVIIIGGGPAGLTAAIYAGRANLEPLVLTGFMPGGQLMYTMRIENFPGFPDGRVGAELMDDFKKQAVKFGAELVLLEVSEVDFSQRPFYIKAGKKEWNARTVIIATGSVPRRLNIPGEGKLFGRGVSSCATCDGAFYGGKHVAVIGGGDTAMEDALFLTRFAEKVTVIHRRDELRASKIMRQKAFDNDKIVFEWNTVVEEIIDQDMLVAGLKLKDVLSCEVREMDVDGVFLAIGHTPQTELYRDQIELDDEGYIVVSDGSKTSVDGVFVAGDVSDPIYRQAVIAAGHGCKAAIDAERYLEGLCS